MRWAKETSTTIQSKLNDETIVLLPIGAVEAHGSHLPLDTDNVLAERLSHKLANRLSNTYVLPTLPFGQVWSLQDFPGSLSISNDVLIPFIVELGESLYAKGIRILGIVNAHLGNAVAIKEAARTLVSRHPDLVTYTFFYPGLRETSAQVRESDPVHASYVHACEIETSIMLYLAEEEVDMSLAIDDYPVIPEEADYTPTPWSTFTETAVLGEATKATREKGEIIVEEAVKRMVRMLQKARAERSR